MKQIQPIQIWKDGQSKTATYISLTIVHDNLQDTATLSYRLCNYVGTGEEIIVEEITTGAISITGQEYNLWGDTLDINEDAYNIAASKLNLQLL